MPIIRDVMSNCAVTIRPDDSLIDAVRVLCEHHLSSAPVVSVDDEVVGFISEPSLMDVLFDKNARCAPVSEFMNRDVYVVGPDDSIASAATMFALYGVRRLPVVENGKLVGVVTRRDLLQYSLTGAGPFNDPLVELIPSIGEYA
ncbi:MAG: CBS domain-containing protein [Planctomycetes bacterium]|nr:CBS domain-containing protein [Planctomycetota bacterium]